MAKIGVIGRREDALCYLAAGFSVYESESDGSARLALERAKEDGCAVIYLTPEFSYLSLTDENEKDENPVPSVIPLPDKTDKTGLSRLKRYVERAVGADIVFRDDNI